MIICIILIYVYTLICSIWFSSQIDEIDKDESTQKEVVVDTVVIDGKKYIELKEE